MFGVSREKNNASNTWACTLSGGKFLALKVQPGNDGKVKIESMRSFAASGWNEVRLQEWLGARARLWISLPPEDVETGVFDKPEVGAGEELEALRWTLGQANNANLADAIIEGFALPGPEEKGLSRNQWWVGGLEKARLEAILRACEQGKATIERIDAHPLPQRAWALDFNDQRAVGLLVLGEHFACLGFVIQEHLLFSKQLDWSRGTRGMPGFGERAELDLQRSLDYFDRRMSSVATGRLLVAGQDAEAVCLMLSSRVALPASAISGREFLEADASFWESPEYGEAVWLLPLCRQIGLSLGARA